MSAVLFFFFFFLPFFQAVKTRLGVNDGLRSEHVFTERCEKPKVLSSDPLLGLLWSSENTCDVRRFQFALQIF